jgi:hypothetical protein
MKLTIETAFKEGKTNLETLTVGLDTNEIANVLKTKGLPAANKAIDNFVARYTEDLKKKLASVLKS